MRTRWFPFLLLMTGVVTPALSSRAQTGLFQGSANSGPASSEPLRLSLEDAQQRGLKYNLGALSAIQDDRQAEAARMSARSLLLPNLNGDLLEKAQQIDLDAFGFAFNPPPGAGFTFPKVLGPSNYFDLRAYMTQRLADVQALRSYQSAREAQHAADLSIVNAREMVIYVVTSGYLDVLAESARVDSAKVQVDSAQAIYQQALDRFKSGLSAKIDMTRSEVELETQQQRLTAEQAAYAKDKIALARMIGLASGQELILTDTLPYAPLDNLTLGDAINQAAENRADLKAAASRIRAAELSRKAADAEWYPTLGISADYGLVGMNPANSHGTFSVAGQLTFPIWAGGRAKADAEQADVALRRSRTSYDDLRARVEADVRSAFLDLTSAADQVRVSNSRRELARDELEQAKDRFASGVADTVEVVQAQEMVSSAEQDYIASLNAHNLAKAAVAHAIGQAEKITRTLLRSQ